MADRIEVFEAGGRHYAVCAPCYFLSKPMTERAAADALRRHVASKAHAHRLDSQHADT